MRKFSYPTTNRYFEHSSLCIVGFKFFAVGISHRRCSVRAGVLKNVCKIHGEKFVSKSLNGGGGRKKTK